MSVLLASPALPLAANGGYVAAAYLIFVVLLVIYVAIMAVRLNTLSRDIGELAELAERRKAERDTAASEPTPGEKQETPA